MSLQRKIFRSSTGSNDHRAPNFLAVKWKHQHDRGHSLTDKQHIIIAQQYRELIPCDSCGGKVTYTSPKYRKMKLKINDELTLRMQEEQWCFACESCGETYLNLNEYERYSKRLLELYNSDYAYKVIIQDWERW